MMKTLTAVMNKVSGEVYLEGQLERGIVPEESVWEHGTGSRENALLLHLHKMNLELLQRHELMFPDDFIDLLACLHMCLFACCSSKCCSVSNAHAVASWVEPRGHGNLVLLSKSHTLLIMQNNTVLNQSI